MTEFKVKSDSEKVDIKRTLEKIKEESINYQNYADFYSLVTTKHEVIESQIQNLLDRWERSKEKFEKFLTNKEIQSLRIEQKIIPTQVLERMEEMHGLLEEAYVWKTYQEEISTVLLEKLRLLLGTIKAMDIEREVLVGMRESSQEFLKTIKSMISEERRLQVEKHDVLKDSINVRFDFLVNSLINKNFEVINKLIENSEDCNKGEAKKQLRKSKEDMLEIDWDSDKGFPFAKNNEEKKEVAEEYKEDLEENVENLDIGIINICGKCQKKFDTKEMLQAHLEFEHDEDNIPIEPAKEVKNGNND